jgi:hypothetical protein
MPPPKKALSPASRAKADKRNEREKTKRAATAAASGGAKSAKKKAKMTDLTEEKMPVSGGGSSCTWKRSGELVFALLEEKQKVHFEAEKRALAEEKSRGYERFLERTERMLELQSRYMKYLEWAESERKKRIEVLEKKYQDVLDLYCKEYDEAQQEVAEYWNQYRTCWFHSLDLLHLCNGKFMDSQEPINHTKLLRKSGFKFKHFD